MTDQTRLAGFDFFLRITICACAQVPRGFRGGLSVASINAFKLERYSRFITVTKINAVVNVKCGSPIVGVLAITVFVTFLLDFEFVLKHVLFIEEKYELFQPVKVDCKW